jgi:hypothetical protein
VEVVQAFRVPTELSAALEAALPVPGEVQGYGKPGGAARLLELSDYSFDIEQVLKIGSATGGAGVGAEPASRQRPGTEDWSSIRFSPRAGLDKCRDAAPHPPADDR